MRLASRITTGFLVLAAIPSLAHGSNVEVTLNPADAGRTFEGVGAVSAGASTRNLVDYPAKERDEVLDYLFKPKFGAGLQHLKVEIGGGENSTCGSEPSHAITREEMAWPRARGYEFWLMSEARRRNPSILLDCLPWCYPRWVSNAFSQDSADWFAAFLGVARRDFNLELDWVAGAQNEMGTDVNWVVGTLRPTLDAHRFSNVRIQAPDDSSRHWEIFDQLKQNPAADKAIQATGYHYPSQWLPAVDANAHPASAQAIASGKPLWASEEFSRSGRDWDTALLWAQLINKNYIQSRITKTEAWCPVDGIYAGLPYSGTGLMQAATPWSGHYEVWPAVWTTAHTTQFADPGWRYLDGACGQIDPKTWKGSYVTLVNPKTRDWSMVICADSKVDFNIRVAEGLKRDQVHVWKSDAQSQFQRLADVSLAAGAARLALDGDAVYSVTTTTGQQKGAHGVSPKASPFPLPYTESFEQYAAAQTPRFFSDQKGTFETAPRGDGKGMCLKQVVPSEGILWHRKYRLPYTVIGDDRWRDYSVQSDVLVASGSVEIGGRCNDEDVLAYSLALKSTGQWSLMCRGRRSEVINGEKVQRPVEASLANGELANFRQADWHALRISFAGPRIIASIDGQQVAEAANDERQHGMAYLASSYDPNCFDNVSILPN